MNTQVARTETFIERLVLKKSFWFIFSIFFFSYPIIRSMNRELPAELPVYGQLPAYSLMDENGTPFGSSDLEGKVYIANFHFTSCPTLCPKIMAETQKIQKRVKGVGQAIAIVSYTVDPSRDSSQVLFKKAREVHANPYVWKFLTGPKNSMHDLVVGGFKVPMGDKEEVEADMFDIAHTQKMVLVDGSGQIRGYYSLDRVSIDKLMIDVGLLINRRHMKYKTDKES